jgi:LPS-assembly lipoprotein
MSLLERKTAHSRALVWKTAFVAALLVLPGLTSCTVQPLYGVRSVNVGAGDPASQLASIAIKPDGTRYGQEVRNHLIFLLAGGAGQPADPRYSLDLGVTSVSESVAIRQVAREDEPSAGALTLTSNYRLTEIATGAVVAAGRRAVTASFDQPRQQFANMRAARDAENRAARELAELIRLAVAQQLEQAP